MENEKLELIHDMATLKNIAKNVTEIMHSTAAADFIEAAIEVINNYPAEGKLVDTGLGDSYVNKIINALK